MTPAAIAWQEFCELEATAAITRSPQTTAEIQPEAAPLTSYFTDDSNDAIVNRDSSFLGSGSATTNTTDTSTSVGGMEGAGRKEGGMDHMGDVKVGVDDVGERIAGERAVERRESRIDKGMTTPVGREPGRERDKDGEEDGQMPGGKEGKWDQDVTRMVLGGSEANEGCEEAPDTRAPGSAPQREDSVHEGKEVGARPTGIWKKGILKGSETVYHGTTNGKKAEASAAVLSSRSSGVRIQQRQTGIGDANDGAAGVVDEDDDRDGSDGGGEGPVRVVAWGDASRNILKENWESSGNEGSTESSGEEREDDKHDDHDNDHYRRSPPKEHPSHHPLSSARNGADRGDLQENDGLNDDQRRVDPPRGSGVRSTVSIVVPSWTDNRFDRPRSTSPQYQYVPPVKTVSHRTIEEEASMSRNLLARRTARLTSSSSASRAHTQTGRSFLQRVSGIQRSHMLRCLEQWRRWAACRLLRKRKILRQHFKRRLRLLRRCFDEWRMWQTPMIYTEQAAALHANRDRPAVLLPPTRVFHVWGGRRHVLGGPLSAPTRIPAQRVPSGVSNIFA